MKKISLTCLLFFAFMASAHSDIAARVKRITASGVDVIAYPMPSRELVSINGAIFIGAEATHGANPALLALLGMMLSRGTEAHDKVALLEKLDEGGIGMGFGGLGQILDFYANFPGDQLAAAMDLLAEQLRRPSFPAEEFAKAKLELVGMMRQGLDDPEMIARRTFGRSVFPQEHPNHPIDLERFLADAQRATLEDLKDFYHEHVGPEHMTLAIAGGIDVAQVHRSVGEAFAGWKGGSQPQRATQCVIEREAHEEKVFMPDRTSVYVMLGQATRLRHNDPDALALRVGSIILGQGFADRLMATVRDRDGLTYGIHSRIENDTFSDGSWAIGATFAPQLLDKGLSATRRELMKWWKEGVTAAELQERKTGIVGEFQLSLATSEGMTTALLTAVQRGYDVSWLDEYPRRVQTLTVADVNRAIRKYIDPEKLTLVAAGTVERP